MIVKKIVIFFVQVAYNINIAGNGCSTWVKEKSNYRRCRVTSLTSGFTQNLTEHRIYGIITLLLLKEGTNIK